MIDTFGILGRMQYNLRMLGIIGLAYLRGAVLFVADLLGSCG